MRTIVEVELVQTKTVKIVVEHEADEDPTDLTEQDRDNALAAAAIQGEPELFVTTVTEVGPA